MDIRTSLQNLKHHEFSILLNTFKKKQLNKLEIINYELQKEQVVNPNPATVLTKHDYNKLADFYFVKQKRQLPPLNNNPSHITTVSSIKFNIIK
jgi:hypothetical protein